MFPHLICLARIQRPRLAQDLVADPDFSQVVQERRSTKRFALFFRHEHRVGDLEADGGHPFRVTKCHGVPGIDCTCQRLDGREGRALERRGLFFQARGHVVEGFGEVADFILGVDHGTMLEFTAGNNSH